MNPKGGLPSIDTYPYSGFNQIFDKRCPKLLFLIKILSIHYIRSKFRKRNLLAIDPKNINMLYINL